MMTIENIHTMIQTCKVTPSVDSINRILEILDAILDRVAENERMARQAGNAAACLANGIKPD